MPTRDELGLPSEGAPVDEQAGSVGRPRLDQLADDGSGT